MKILACILALCGAGLLFVSCRQDVGAALSGLTVRVSVESEKTDTADVRVYLEGNDGNLVTGSLVIVKSEQNTALKLDFDYTGGVYAGSYPIPPDGIIYIEISSALLDEPAKLSILHKPVLIRPAVQTLQDESGNSALYGQSLQHALVKQIGWNSCGDGIAYQVIIKDAFGIVYAKTTEALTVDIPAESIPPGTGYAVQIIAQKINGDPFFIANNYYSAAVNKGSLVSFNVDE